MKSVHKIVYVSDDGQEHETPREARVADMSHLLESLKLNWPGINSHEIASALYANGHEISARDPNAVEG